MNDFLHHGAIADAAAVDAVVGDFNIIADRDKVIVRLPGGKDMRISLKT